MMRMNLTPKGYAVALLLRLGKYQVDDEGFSFPSWPELLDKRYVITSRKDKLRLRWLCLRVWLMKMLHGKNYSRGPVL